MPSLLTHTLVRTFLKQAFTFEMHRASNNHHLKTRPVHMAWSTWNASGMAYAQAKQQFTLTTWNSRVERFESHW